MKRAFWIVSGWLMLLATAHADEVADRINAAIPIPKTTQSSWMELNSMAINAEERRKLKNDFNTQLKLRALGCSLLFSPSKSTTKKEIVDRLSGSACMEKADDTLAAWLKWRHVELLLRMPPIRPALTSAPPLISVDNIQDVRFAPAAGVGLLWANQKLSIIDLQNKRRIFHDESPRTGFPGQFSPNGRLLVIYETFGVAALIDSETGQTIRTLFANPNEVFWLDDRVAMFVDGSNRGMMLVDFHTGNQQKIDFLHDKVLHVAALPHRPGVFIAFSHKTAMLLNVDSKGAEPQIRLLAEKPFEFQNAFRYPGTMNSDGRYYINVSGNIAITSTDTLDTEFILLDPFSVDQAIPLPKGDEVLLSGTLPYSNNGREGFVYSISGHTIARVDRDKAPANKFVYVPGAKSIACVANTDISFVGELPVQNPVTVPDFVARETDEASGKVGKPNTGMVIPAPPTSVQRAPAGVILPRAQ